MSNNKNKNIAVAMSEEKISLGKLMCFLSIVLFLGGTGLDYFSAPHLIKEIFSLRLAMCANLSAIICLITFKPYFFLKFYDYVISFLFLSSSATILTMIFLTDVNDIAHDTYFAGLMLIIVTVFLGTYIPTLLSIILSISIISAFLSLSFYINTSLNLVANHVFFLGSSLIVGIISNAMKNGQLSQILLLQSSLKESLRNQHLETERQSELARIDSITNIPNRRYGSKLLEKMLTNAEQLDMAVVTYFLDLNGFKQINDTYGHNVGDEVLHVVATRVLNAGRKSDIFYRQGGDEFIYAIMIKKQNLDFVHSFDHMLRETISPIIEVDGLRLAVSSSIGTAVYPTNGYSVAALIKHADERMYEDKAEHKMSIYKPIPRIDWLQETDEHESRVLSFSQYRKNKPNTKSR